MSLKEASFLGNPIIPTSITDAALQDPECHSVSRVLVLYTGGTIGMSMVNGSYCAVSNFFLPSLSKMPTFCDFHNNSASQYNHLSIFSLPINRGHRIIYTVVEYYPLLDSSDMSINEWSRISNDVYVLYDNFDGFIILHGTDTLAYTAAALTFMFENLNKPVIITGAQLPVFEFRSDGWNNFLGALLVAGGGYAIPEVVVFFNNKLFRGSRVAKFSSKAFDVFDSPNYPILAEMNTEFNINFNLIFRPNCNRLPFHVLTNLCCNVAILNVFPLIPIEHVQAILSPSTQGVVLRTYGSGNVPSSRQDILDLLKSAADRGVLIINVTQCWHGGVKAIYSNGIILAKYGVIPGYDITTEAAVLKLAYVLSKQDLHDYSSMRGMLLRSLRGEVTIEVEDSMIANSSDPLLGRIAKQNLLTTYFSTLSTNSLQNDCEDSDVIWVRLTPMFACYAAAKNHVTRLKELHSLLGHLQLSDAEGCTPLHKSCMNNHIDATKYLLNCGLSVHATNNRNLTPLDSVLDNQHPSEEIVQLLLDVGAVLNTSGNRELMKSINQAIVEGNLIKLRLYFLCGYAFDKYDYEGRSVLHVAVNNRKLEVIRFFLSPNITLQMSNPSQSCLLKFDNPDTSCGRCRRYQYTISQQFTILNDCFTDQPSGIYFKWGIGLSPFLKTEWGTTPLDEAKLRNFDEIVDFLELAMDIKCQSTY